MMGLKYTTLKREVSKTLRRMWSKEELHADHEDVAQQPPQNYAGQLHFSGLQPPAVRLHTLSHFPIQLFNCSVFKRFKWDTIFSPKTDQTLCQPHDGHRIMIVCQQQNHKNASALQTLHIYVLISSTSIRTHKMWRNTVTSSFEGNKSNDEVITQSVVPRVFSVVVSFFKQSLHFTSWEMLGTDDAHSNVGPCLWTGWSTTIRLRATTGVSPRRRVSEGLELDTHTLTSSVKTLFQITHDKWSIVETIFILDQSRKSTN